MISSKPHEHVSSETLFLIQVVRCLNLVIASCFDTTPKRLANEGF